MPLKPKIIFKNITAAVCGVALTVAFPLTTYAQAAPDYDAPSPGSSLGLGQEMEDADEAGLIESITQQTLARLKAQYPAGKRRVLRDAHPKTHGLVRAEFIVVDNIPQELQHGVFAKARKFDALIRFSAGGIAVQSDTVEQARGMAIKLLAVEGEKILDDERNALTQDFVMINFPVFFSRNLKDYEELHRAMAAGTTAAFFNTRPIEKQAFYQLNHQLFYNPLQVRYWSETPYKLGSKAIKFSARPITRQANVKPAVTGADYLREVMVKQVGREDVYFEFLIQVQTDPVKMPVEDSVVAWSEADAPFQRVALIRIPKQDISDPATQEVAEQLSFTPWHALPEHRPLGSINRARRVIYQALSEFRHTMNSAPRREPSQYPSHGQDEDDDD